MTPTPGRDRLTSSSGSPGPVVQFWLKLSPGPVEHLAPWKPLKLGGEQNGGRVEIHSHRVRRVLIDVIRLLQGLCVLSFSWRPHDDADSGSGGLKVRPPPAAPPPPCCLHLVFLHLSLSLYLSLCLSEFHWTLTQNGSQPRTELVNFLVLIQIKKSLFIRLLFLTE